ncbi:ATP-dependent nuclease [Pedobacter steynii]|uniref:ATP-dependent endonuclease n=1 Tax=Pedobacter steynii TaxID=430522 RepID=A0A1D7QMV6_9SPHI|nr:AAA family ATPase [Pedobacter steynii]AOM80000.1 ATP-dependent endonuclease [Pedobacter steynii]
MYINKVTIKNFKSYKDQVSIKLNDGLNILVGNNETGKSTILEAIHLALSGLSNGKYIKNELSEYLFNQQSVSDYLESLKNKKPIPPPEISIKIFITGENMSFFEGDGNSPNQNECCISLKIALDDSFRNEYNKYITGPVVSALPIEFYSVNWETCAREKITPRTIPIKSALIDSSSNRYKNGSDIYISHIIKNHLEVSHKNDLAQAHRKLQAAFLEDDAVIKVNQVIGGKGIDSKNVQLTIDLSSKDAWEHSFLTCVDDIPFHHIGKGEQAIIKTKLALQHKKTEEANIILLEEPENHLSHSKLNQLIRYIHDKCSTKQILISTHSSFVANKLGLKNLILIANKSTLRLDDLNADTQEFFEKIPGYDTLRLILCKKAILVEGDCDELIVQRAYMDANSGKMPIEDEVDVISVGTSFLRFLEIADKISKEVCVVTDNDGKVPELKKKYSAYLGDNRKTNIKICFDEVIDTGSLEIKGKKFNYNTLEPKFLKENGLQKFKEIFDQDRTEEQWHIYMKANKTDCALKIFSSPAKLKYPKYILDAIEKK